MPSEHEKETAFLRCCIRYDESALGRHLDERIAQVQRDEQCLRRASWLMALVGALAVAGLGYAAILLDDFPSRMSVFSGQFVIKILCTLGIGSLICLLAFTGLGLVYRRELNLRREECRRLVTLLLELHLGDPDAPARNGSLKKHEAVSLRGRMGTSVPETAIPTRSP
jgi:hypothetical protein